MLQDIPRQLHVIDTTLEAFSEHLRTHRGASPGTCDRNSREVRKLLERTCGDAPLDFSRLTTAALRAFVIERATTWSPRTGRRAATAVRSFLRFLHLLGLSDGALVHAVPAVQRSRAPAWKAGSARPLRPRPPAVLRSRNGGSHPIRCGTPRRCISCSRASTSLSSRSGSVTRAQTPHTSTSRPIWP